MNFRTFQKKYFFIGTFYISTFYVRTFYVRNYYVRTFLWRSYSGIRAAMYYNIVFTSHGGQLQVTSILLRKLSGEVIFFALTSYFAYFGLDLKKMDFLSKSGAT